MSSRKFRIPLAALLGLRSRRLWCQHCNHRGEFSDAQYQQAASERRGLL